MCVVLVQVLQYGKVHVMHQFLTAHRGEMLTSLGHAVVCEMV